MLNKKKLFILIGAIAILIVAVLIIIFSDKNDSGVDINGDGAINETINLNPTEFMSDEEKARFQLPLDSKIQVLKKKESGETDVYRIIRTEDDIVLDPSRIGDPNMLQPKQTAN